MLKVKEQSFAIMIGCICQPGLQHPSTTSFIACIRTMVPVRASSRWIKMDVNFLRSIRPRTMANGVSEIGLLPMMSVCTPFFQATNTSTIQTQTLPTMPFLNSIFQMNTNGFVQIHSNRKEMEISLVSRMILLRIPFGSCTVRIDEFNRTR